MRSILTLCATLCFTSCMTDHGRQIPPVGVWSYQSSSMLHARVIEIDLYSDASFSIRQAAGDSKTMTRRYRMLGSGTYTAEGNAIHFKLSAPIKQHTQKGAAPTLLTGEIAPSGTELWLNYFGEQVIFTWRSPS
jgi:hypothetical protein